ncbi:MAG: tetratricopeptide repeat protein [Pseudomonadota bacterium]
MTLYSILAIVSLLLAILVLARVWPWQIPGRGGDATLRAILLARAAGEIDEAEFARRQEALHAALLATPPAPAAPRRYWALPLLLGAALFGWLAWQGGTEGEGAMDMPAATAAKPGAAPLLDSIMKTDKQANSGGDLKSLAKPLADKLAKDPGNGEGWLLLARTYRELHQYAEALPAYERASALLPADAALLAEWADAYVIVKGRKWDDVARGLVKRALAANPRHPMSLALAGSEAFERGDLKAAIGYWERMRDAAPAGSMDAKLAEANIQEATRLMGAKR